MKLQTLLKIQQQIQIQEVQCIPSQLTAAATAQINSEIKKPKIVNQILQIQKQTHLKLQIKIQLQTLQNIASKLAATIASQTNSGRNRTINL